MILDFEDSQTLLKLTLTDLVHDFGARYKKNMIDSVDNYFEFLD